MRGLFFSVIVLLFATLASCDTTPKGVLGRTKMEQIIYDVHIAEGMIDELNEPYRSENAKKEMIAAVLIKNGVSKATFDTSMVWYGSHLDKYMKVYSAVVARLKEENAITTELLALYEKSLLTPEGDTVDIWRASHQMIFESHAMTRSKLFRIKGDQNFQPEDSLAWRLKVLNIAPDSLASLYLTLGIRYSLADEPAISLRPDSNGWVELGIKTKEVNPGTSIYGSVTYIEHTQAKLEPLLIDSISLVRYHKLVVASDSIAVVDSVNVNDTTVVDPLQLDLPRPRIERLESIDTLQFATPQ